MKNGGKVSGQQDQKKVPLISHSFFMNLSFALVCCCQGFYQIPEGEVELQNLTLRKSQDESDRSDLVNA